MTAIVAENLYKSFNEVHAVNGLSLTVQEGEIYGLVGPDGAGKTTTMRLICGGFNPDKGSVSIRGFDLAHHAEQARSQIGYLAQRFSLYGDLTVTENLHFFAQMHGLKASEWKPRAQEILQFVGLAEFADRMADQLSGGMKQKLGLATALVHRPQGAAARRTDRRRRSGDAAGFLAVDHPHRQSGRRVGAGEHAVHG